MTTTQQTQQQGIEVPAGPLPQMGSLGSFGWARGQQW